jgi:hypothetical protein
MFLVIVFILAVIALLPCFFIWVIAFGFLPQQYKTTSLNMTAICFLLSLATGFVLNVELENGALSGVAAILEFSLLWALFLVLINSCLKVASNKKIQKK